MSARPQYSPQCVPGCVCPDGLVADGEGGCIASADCPCVHNEGSYQAGQTIRVGCNTWYGGSGSRPGGRLPLKPSRPLSLETTPSQAPERLPRPLGGVPCPCPALTSNAPS